MAIILEILISVQNVLMISNLEESFQKKNRKWDVNSFEYGRSSGLFGLLKIVFVHLKTAVSTNIQLYI